MKKPHKIKHVALALPLGLPDMEMHIRGIARYAGSHSHWRMAVSPESPVISFASLRHWHGDGIIALLNTAADARLVRELGVPAVNISGALQHSGVPRVTVDNRAVGALAAEHLLECGFRHFGFYGIRELWYCQERLEGFRRRVEEAGCHCSSLLVPHTLGKQAAWSEADYRLQQWLRSLAPPVGVLAVSDYRARMALDACAQIGLKVPDDVALLGVDNDPIACEFCDPPLSSVSRNAEHIGFEAAALLDRLMAGRSPPPDDVLIAPERVVRRRSSDVVAIENPEVAAAARYMREHLAEPISMNELAFQQGVSRRWLQTAFRQAVHRSPHQYLNFLRIRRARQLLVEEPSMTLAAVARACGFSDAKRLRAAFARFVGVSPNDYRRVQGVKPAPPQDAE